VISFAGRRLKLCIHLSCIIIVPIYIFLLEIFARYSSYKTFEAMTAIFPIVAVYSQGNYNHLHAFFAYTICLVFNIVRTYFWLDNLTRYLRFNTFALAGFVLVYILSRSSQKVIREKFKQSWCQGQSLNLLDSFVSFYHDGLIITSKDHIMYFNNQAFSIFLSNQLNQAGPTGSSNQQSAGRP
jgi:hypothetical protein